MTTTQAQRLPTLNVGNVITMANADGYWVVTGDHPRDGRFWEVCQALPGGHRGAQAWVGAEEVELVFANEAAATDYRMALATAATGQRIRETLHGDPNYCRGCAKGWAGAKWHREDCPVIAARNAQAAKLVPPNTDATNVWSPVNELRNAVKAHLHYETKQGTHKRMGHFAVAHEGTLKFLVIKEILAGRYAGRVFVDSMASATAYPVKTPAMLTNYLAAVLADPGVAAKRYADELGQCSDCNRPLTNEESRAYGIGPECRSKR